MDRNDLSLVLCHVGVPSAVYKMIFWADDTFGANYAPILHQNKHYLQRERSEIPNDPCHLRVQSGASEMISEPLACSTQTMHLSCIKIRTISKWTEMSYHFDLGTEEYHRVRPKWFLSHWYVWGKLCTYLAPKLTLSPNESWDSTWPASPRSSIGCVQKDVRAYGTYYANRASILRQD
jgi:hypothetical protein